MTKNDQWPLVTRAPGKLVVWGEYAVLEGASAGVMAVNRYANCQFRPSSGPWTLATTGFEGQQAQLAPNWLSESTPPLAASGQLLWHAAQAAGFQADDKALKVSMDSAEFFHQGQKLGLGSSAAVCTALYEACCTLAGSTSTLAGAQLAHRNAQDGRGSGIDVAASYLGGTLLYTDGVAQPFAWPQSLHWRALWTGASASTTEHLRRFETWRTSKGPHTSYADLIKASNGCAATISATAMADYTEQLWEFDLDSKIGIYAKGHADLHKLARSSGVIYKPCGAGGGDLGMAFAEDPERLDQFMRSVERLTVQRFVEINVELASHGVTAVGGHHLPHS